MRDLGWIIASVSGGIGLIFMVADARARGRGLRLPPWAHSAMFLYGAAAWICIGSCFAFS
jgi:hypothetical protein